MKTIEQSAQECFEKARFAFTDANDDALAQSIIAAAMREVVEPLKIAGVAAIEAASKYGATGYYENVDDLKAEFASKGTIEIFEQLRAKANERDQLRAALDVAEGALDEIGKYHGVGSCTTPWRDIVADCGDVARTALARIAEARKGQP